MISQHTSLAFLPKIMHFNCDFTKFAISRDFVIPIPGTFHSFGTLVSYSFGTLVNKSILII